MMTTASPGPLSDAAAGDGAHADGRPWDWRRRLAIAVWIGVVAGGVLLVCTFWSLLGLALGQALHVEVDIGEKVALFQTFLWLGAGLAVTAVAAIVARRWVAVVMAVLLAGGSAFLALMLYTSVQSVVAPIERVDEGPLPCVCHSGGTCDCPGG